MNDSDSLNAEDTLLYTYQVPSWRVVVGLPLLVLAATSPIGLLDPAVWAIAPFFAVCVLCMLAAARQRVELTIDTLGVTEVWPSGLLTVVPWSHVLGFTVGRRRATIHTAHGRIRLQTGHEGWPLVVARIEQQLATREASIEAGSGDALVLDVGRGGAHCRVQRVILPHPVPFLVASLVLLMVLVRVSPTAAPGFAALMVAVALAAVTSRVSGGVTILPEGLMADGELIRWSAIRHIERSRLDRQWLITHDSGTFILDDSGADSDRVLALTRQVLAARAAGRTEVTLVDQGEEVPDAALSPARLTGGEAERGVSRVEPRAD